MSVETDKLPPVPQHDPPVDEGNPQRLFTPNWMRWFLQVKFKVDNINASLVALSKLVSGGFAVLTASGTWTSRTITGTPTDISVTNGDGVSGNPTIDLIDTAVTPGTYGSATKSAVIVVDHKGRLTGVTEATISGGGGSSGYPSGTSFPAGPTAEDRFDRTDLNLICYYDGTRWLTLEEFRLNGTQINTIFPITNSGNYIRWDIPSANDIYVTGLNASVYINTPNSGSSFWTVAVAKTDASNTLTTLTGGSFSTGTTPDSVATHIRHDLSLGEVVATATYLNITLACTKTGTPGTLYVHCTLRFRLVVT